MANMSYCRFENTLNDMRECREAMYESTTKMNDREKRARKKLFELVVEMADEIENMSDNIRDNGIDEEEE